MAGRQAAHRSPWQRAHMRLPLCYCSMFSPCQAQACSILSQWHCHMLICIFAAACHAIPSNGHASRAGCLSWGPWLQVPSMSHDTHHVHKCKGCNSCRDLFNVRQSVHQRMLNVCLQGVTLNSGCSIPEGKLVQSASAAGKPCETHAVTERTGRCSHVHASLARMTANRAACGLNSIPAHFSRQLLHQWLQAAPAPALRPSHTEQQ